MARELGPIHEDHWTQIISIFLCILNHFFILHMCPIFAEVSCIEEVHQSAQGLNWCRHLCTACTLWMKIHISRTYWVELQPSVEIKIWRGIPDSVDHWPFPIFMHHRNRKLQELKCHLLWCMYMKFHFELVCASPYSDISEQDEKQMCSEHYQKHFDMLFCSIQIQKSTGYITKKNPSIATYPCGGLYRNS